VRSQLTAHDRTIGFHDVRLAELDLRVQCAETTNYDGILIWKIVEYPRRKREAVTGKLQYCSQPVVTLKPHSAFTGSLLFSQLSAAVMRHKTNDDGGRWNRETWQRETM